MSDGRPNPAVPILPDGRPNIDRHIDRRAEDLAFALAARHPRCATTVCRGLVCNQCGNTNPAEIEKAKAEIEKAKAAEVKEIDKAAAELNKAYEDRYGGPNPCPY